MEQRSKIWPLYSKFVAYAAIGCAVSFAAHVLLLTSLEIRTQSKESIGLLGIHDLHPVVDNALLAQYQSNMARSNILYGLYFAFQPIGFICFSVVKLLVLERSARARACVCCVPLELHIMSPTNSHIHTIHIPHALAQDACFQL